jgi:FKBP-type peptidyl-prolyl cis-trans isomerase FklB
MKVKIHALLMTTVLALNAAAQPNTSPQPTPRPSQAMPPGLLRPPGAPGAPGANQPAPVMPDKDTLSYFIGMSVGNSIKKQDLTVDVDGIAAAIRDIIAGRAPRFSEAKYAEIQRQVSGALRAKMTVQRQAEQAKLEKEGAENKAKADVFLAKNASEPGIKILTNGLQYKAIKEGTGETPGPHDNVTVAYKGSLIDGVVFDQNTNFPAQVNRGIIKGWSEMLQQMKVGSEVQAFIPPDLAYGLHPPATSKIPPNSVLIFDMELLSTKPAATPAAPTAAKGAPISTVARATPPPSSGGPPSPASSTPVVSGQIIKVPSADELKKGAKIEVITNVPSQ